MFPHRINRAQFSKKHYLFLLALFLFLLAIYAVADENSPLRQENALLVAPEPIPDQELEDLLNRALALELHEVEVNVSQCLIEVSTYYSHSCTGAYGQPLLGILQEQHYVFDLDEVQDVRYDPPLEEGDWHLLYFDWDIAIRPAIEKSISTLDAYKKAENYESSSYAESVAILARGSLLALQALEEEGVTSKRYRRVCTGDLSGSTLDLYNEFLGSRNDLMRSAYREVKQRQKLCRTGWPDI